MKSRTVFDSIGCNRKRILASLQAAWRNTDFYLFATSGWHGCDRKNAQNEREAEKEFGVHGNSAFFLWAWIRDAAQEKDAAVMIVPDEK